MSAVITSNSARARGARMVVELESNRKLQDWETEWPEFMEKLKHLLKQYTITVRKIKR